MFEYNCYLVQSLLGTLSVVTFLLQAAAAHEEISPVPEPDIAPGKQPQPQTKSGCTVS